MNPEPEIHTAQADAAMPESPTPFAYRGNGKVARLPKPIRDKICHWMLDGLSYPDIIERLAPDGKDLNPGHLCEWRKRRYQDWLLEQAFIERTRARQEPATGLSSDFDATQVGHAALQLGTLQIFEALRDLAAVTPQRGEGDLVSPKPAEGCVPVSDNQVCDLHQRPSGVNSDFPQPSTPSVSSCSTPPSHPTKNRKSLLDLRLGGDTAAFVRLINALARASRETMLVQKYRDACAKARAAIQPLKDATRKLTDAERRSIVLEVDDILGLNSDEPSPDTETPPSESQTLQS